MCTCKRDAGGLGPGSMATGQNQSREQLGAAEMSHVQTQLQPPPLAAAGAAPREEGHRGFTIHPGHECMRTPAPLLVPCTRSAPFTAELDGSSSSASCVALASAALAPAAACAAAVSPIASAFSEAADPKGGSTGPRTNYTQDAKRAQRDHGGLIAGFGCHGSHGPRLGATQPHTREPLPPQLSVSCARVPMLSAAAFHQEALANRSRPRLAVATDAAQAAPSPRKCRRTKGALGGSFDSASGCSDSETEEPLNYVSAPSWTVADECSCDTEDEGGAAGDKEEGPHSTPAQNSNRSGVTSCSTAQPACSLGLTSAGAGAAAGGPSTCTDQGLHHESRRHHVQQPAGAVGTFMAWRPQTYAAALKMFSRITPGSIQTQPPTEMRSTAVSNPPAVDLQAQLQMPMTLDSPLPRLPSTAYCMHSQPPDATSELSGLAKCLAPSSRGAGQGTRVSPVNTRKRGKTMDCARGRGLSWDSLGEACDWGVVADGCARSFIVPRVHPPAKRRQTNKSPVCMCMLVCLCRSDDTLRHD